MIALIAIGGLVLAYACYKAGVIADVIGGLISDVIDAVIK